MPNIRILLTRLRAHFRQIDFAATIGHCDHVINTRLIAALTFCCAPLLAPSVGLVWPASLPVPSAATGGVAGEQGPGAKRSVMAATGISRVIDFRTDQGTLMSVDTSPDGRWIVFDLLGHIYRISAAGGLAQCLTQGSGVALNMHPRFSPDGREIAFVSLCAHARSRLASSKRRGLEAAAAGDPNSTAAERDVSVLRVIDFSQRCATLFLHFHHGAGGGLDLRDRF
jgi:hypothetical protein